MEWFDWSVYAFFVPYFAASFFPTDDRPARILSAFAIFAVGFFFRPLGAAVLGSYADRHGRRPCSSRGRHRRAVASGE